MNQKDITSLLPRRFIIAQHPLGRFCLHLHVELLRLRANWLSNSHAIL
jgi:hypothetical protein